MQVIHTLEELDAKIRECDNAGLESEDRMRALLADFRMDVPQNLPADPFSPAYRDAQMALYKSITGKAYSSSAEVTKFDVDSAVERPFPFYTGSSAVAGEYFSAIGFVLESMALPPASRVLEFGAGWGWTSVLLAQLGHQVTVIEIEPCFCELISRRAAKEGVKINVINAEFFHVEEMKEQFDAVLFYDCFHHCDDHLRLLRALNKVVAPSGRLFFGAEPIESGFPYPWGIRLDGWALWAVRKNGWLELGFRDDYFASALSRTGWFGRRLGVVGHNRQRVWEACRRESVSFRFTANAPEIKTQIGRLEGERLSIDGRRRGFAVYGPYIDLPAGTYVARIGLFESARRGGAVMDVTAEAGKLKLVNLPLAVGTVPEVAFKLKHDMAKIEVRLHTERGFAAEIEFVEIAPR